jgi:hypothetical protein
MANTKTGSGIPSGNALAEMSAVVRAGLREVENTLVPHSNSGDAEAADAVQRPAQTHSQGVKAEEAEAIPMKLKGSYPGSSQDCADGGSRAGE